MSELNWYWTYTPYLDTPEKQKESAILAGYNKVVFKSEADKVIAEKDKEIAKLNDKLRHYQIMVALLESDKEKIAELEHKVALLHKQCIMHKLQAEELRFYFWHEQHKWWESEDRGDTKPLFDYGEKERMVRRRIFKLTRKLKEAK